MNMNALHSLVPAPICQPLYSKTSSSTSKCATADALNALFSLREADLAEAFAFLMQAK